jgi:hypothetical protein
MSANTQIDTSNYLFIFKKYEQLQKVGIQSIVDAYYQENKQAIDFVLSSNYLQNRKIKSEKSAATKAANKVAAQKLLEKIEGNFKTKEQNLTQGATEQSRLQLYNNIIKHLFKKDQSMYLNYLENQTFTIALDKLYLLCTYSDFDFKTYTSKNLYFSPIKTLSVFQDCYEVYFNGIKSPIARVLTNPKKGHLIYKEKDCKLEMNNSILYEEDWKPALDTILAETGLNIKCYSHVDIAIDGANHLIPFLNQYVRHDDSVITRLGRANYKGKDFDVMKEFQAGVLKKGIGFENFRIGSLKRQLVTIYNKSNEIKVASGKHYIPKFWAKNGLIPEADEDIYRCELRMTSEAINRYKDFHYSQLTEAKNLQDYFTTATNNFFGFVYNDDTNKSRCTPIPMFPEKIRGDLLPKSQRTRTDTRFKAKMQLSKFIDEFILDKFDDKYDLETQLKSTVKVIEEFELKDRAFELFQNKSMELLMDAKELQKKQALFFSMFSKVQKIESRFFE